MGRQQAGSRADSTSLIVIAEQDFSAVHQHGYLQEADLADGHIVFAAVSLEREWILATKGSRMRWRSNIGEEPDEILANPVRK